MSRRHISLSRPDEDNILASNTGDLKLDNAASDDRSTGFIEEMQSSFVEGIVDTPTSLTQGTTNTVPDIMLLNILCARAKAPKETEESRIDAQMSWQPVREWLAQHNAETVRMAAEQRGESGLTALHFACRNVPPLDVIDVFLSIAADTVQWPDSFGWLPIHYACASGSDSAVIHALADAYPESKTTTDRRGRTPLHFALGDKPASPDVIVLLSSSGAASYPDEIGMLVRKHRRLEKKKREHFVVPILLRSWFIVWRDGSSDSWTEDSKLTTMFPCIRGVTNTYIFLNSPSITPVRLELPKTSCSR